MADIGADLITYLKSILNVRTIVGNGAAARIYQHRAVQGKQLSYITFEVYEGTSAEYISGITGIASNRVEITCYGATSIAAYRLAEAVRLAPLQMYRGTMGDSFVLSVQSDGGYERGFDAPTAGGNQKRYWVERDYIIRFHEDVTDAV